MMFRYSAQIAGTPKEKIKKPCLYAKTGLKKLNEVTCPEDRRKT
jgi:hypothetical protein